MRDYIPDEMYEKPLKALERLIATTLERAVSYQEESRRYADLAANELTSACIIKQCIADTEEARELNAASSSMVTGATHVV